MFKILPLIGGLLLLCSALAFSQTREVTGVVTSEDDGVPIPGANVMIKSASTGTVTDSNGRFVISINDNQAVLVISFIGFETQEVAVGSQSTLQVKLKTDTEQLGEVVVVGYGTQLRQDLTGNISSVKGSAIQNVPVNSFEQAIQGRAAGVLITAQNGKLGQGINVRVRGSSSITAGNEPLYVIDGMIVNSGNLSSSTASTNPMADINFNDIESFEILKDASAAAIYGSRASNGVVLITTKRGKAGKTNITVGMQYGSSKPTNHREFLNAEQYIELFREAAVNRDKALGYDPVNNPDDYPGSYLEEIEGTFDFLSGDTDWRNLENSTDWEKEAYQKAGFFNFDVSLNGGTEKTKVYFNLGRSDQDGILIGNSFTRTSGRLNLDHQINRKIKIGANINVVRTENNRVADDRQFYSPMQLVAQSPLTPVRDKQGNLYDNNLNPAMFYYPATVELENSHFITTVDRNIVALTGRYDITPTLGLVAEYGFDLLSQYEDRFQNSKTEDGSSVGGYGINRMVRQFNQTTRTYLNYVKTFNSIHSVDATLGFDLQNSKTNVLRAEGQNFGLDDLRTLSSAAEPTVAFSSIEEDIFPSFYARLNYKLKNKYLISVSSRADGSSRFGPGNKYGFFPAASLGWIISEEDFLATNSSISLLKLRASYGLTGNAGIPNYQYQGVYQSATYGTSSGLTTVRIPNSDLSWETTAQLDIGIDFGLFNDRLTAQFDYYDKQTSDLLLDREIPSVTGFSSILSNIGELENKGFEVVINYSIVRSNTLTWNVGFNFGQNKNKILSLANGQQIIDPSSTRFLNVVKVGEPIGVFYGPEYAGVNPANGDALWFVNGETPGETTNNYNLARKVTLGNPTPTTVYGFTMDAKYKGFDLNVLFQGVAGNKIFNAAGQFMSANARYEDNQTVDQLRRWQKPGDITDVPQPRLYRNNGAQASSRALSDGDYLRLKTITLGYNFPTAILEKIKLSQARIYVTGQNLLTFTKYEGWDPEVNTDYTSGTSYFLGNDFYSAPQAKSFIVGVKLGF